LKFFSLLFFSRSRSMTKKKKTHSFFFPFLSVQQQRQEYDDLPEAAFYMVGDIKEVIEKADRMAKEIAAK
jgi:F0F1-type ATP synthase beta subunit